jgi:hypothetical protein
MTTASHPNTFSQDFTGTRRAPFLYLVGKKPFLGGRV